MSNSSNNNLRLVAFSMLLLVGSDDSAFSQARGSSPDVRNKTFEIVWKTVNEKYFDPGFSGTDWAEVRRRYAPKIANVANDAELHALLDAMVKEIPISHLRMLEVKTLEDSVARSFTKTGVALRDIAGQVVVSRVREDSPAQAAGLRPGFVIKQIGGVPVVDARAAESSLALGIPPHKVTFLDGHDSQRDVVLENRLPQPAKLANVQLLTATRYAFVESKRLADGIGYIHFTNFIVPLKAKLLAAIESMKDAPGLILDLRGNSGGDELGMSVAGMLLGKETQLAITKTRKGDDNSYKARPQKHSYPGPVVILIDEETASEGEQLSATLRDLGRVVLFGKTTRGADMDATVEYLPTGAFLLYPIGQPRTMKGTVIEGRGAIPDVEVSLTREDLLQGKDAQLDAALEYLRKQKR